jgi:drug/metabolite transporter (DMT)-like permease
MVKKFLFGVSLGILGVVLFSSKAVMVKLAYYYEVDAITMVLLRMLFSFPFYIVIGYLHRNDVQ